MNDEEWKDIPGYEGLYKINQKGDVYSFFTGKLRKDCIAGKGYKAIQLSDGHGKKKKHYVHRLVATTFLGPPPFPNAEVNHINCDKSDNSVENLEWTTFEENMRHAYMNGRTDYRRPIRRDNKTGYKGVYAHSGGYEASFCGKYIGWFKNLEDAIDARKMKEAQYEH